MPTEKNYQNAQTAQWVAFFGGFPDLMFKLKSFVVPTISAATVELGGTDYTSLTMPGDHLQYDELQLSFFVDVDYKNYRRLVSWLKYNARHPQPYLSDLTIHMLDNQGKFQGVSFNYEDGFPTLLGSIDLDSENVNTNISCTVAISYNEIRALDANGAEDAFVFIPN